MTQDRKLARDWQLVFEQWRAARYHIRRELDGPFYCGMLAAPGHGGRIAFEDELDDEQMCRTCRRGALRDSGLGAE